MTTKERLDSLLQYSSLSMNAFAKRIGLERSQVLYDIDKGKIKSISVQLAGKIRKAYPEINPIWITTGEGIMITETKPIPNNNYIDPNLEDDMILTKELFENLNDLIRTKNLRIAELEQENAELRGVKAKRSAS